MFWLYAQFYYYWIKILNQFYGHIKVTIYIYTILKYIFKKTPSLNTSILKCLTVLLSPIVFITIWILKITKTLITILIAYNEPNYVSMLDGTESIFIAQETKESRAIITTLFLLEDKKQNTNDHEFYNFCVENIAKTFSKDKFIKLQCSVQYKYGHFYFKKETWSNKAGFKDFNLNSENSDGHSNNNNDYNLKTSTITMEQLRLYVSKVSNEEMPQNGACLWEARVSHQKLEGSNLYPVILRFHHIFGDAITLFNMFSVDFQNNVKSNLKQPFDTVVNSLNSTYTHKPFITMNGMVDPPDSNVLCQTTGDKHIVWYTESKPTIINTIKQIKQEETKRNRVRYCTTVVDVVLTCFMESLTSYFVKLNINLPDTVYTVLPMMPPHVKYRPYGKVTNYDMSNKISLGFLRLPLKIKDSEGKTKDSLLIKRLETIKQEYNVFKSLSLDYWCNRWQGTVLITLLPWFLQKWFVLKYGISIMVSNIPGCDSLEFFGRCKVKEFVVIDPNTSISGVSLMITSYEKRLNFAYTIDKAVIPNIEDVKKLSTDFMDNLNKLKQLTT